MNEQQTKQAIVAALRRFDADLAQASRALFETLGYRSEKRIDLAPNTPEQFVATFDSGERLSPGKAMLDEWASVDLLFQLTDDEIRFAGQGQLPFDSSQRVDQTIIQSYLFFAVDLRGEQYTRTQLAGITREINKLFPMPVLVLFRHGQALTLSIINRRLHKRDPSKDVLEKVTLIKDVDLTQPHRAHVEILSDLSLDQLSAKYSVSNFVELHRAWGQVLDTSELNKRFFREVANWYFWAVQKVTFPKGAGADKETRNAVSVIRLITRLIFCWFIKEKDLVPVDLFIKRKVDGLLNYADPKSSTYYKAILQNLFFATLNQEMNTPDQPDRRIFRHKARQKGGRDQHYMVHNVYRYEDYFKNSAEALQLFSTIPFLNGGLFECLDRQSPDSPDTILRIDGFSDRPDNDLVVPDYLFFSGEREIDLNEVYGTSGRRYIVRGLIDIFDSYKFTVEENTPIEEEVALDPELLGKVFENLLAAYNPETGVTARKRTGSFYTPREIVGYMVDESLIAYLESKIASPLPLAGEGAGVRENLRHLLAYNDEPHRFTEDQVALLIEAINTLKLLDPACGSGAFPMGALHKLVFILAKLDPHNERWKETQIATVAQIPDSAIRAKVITDIEQAFERNELDYGRKLYLIENCIYGVDIQPIAVQIAKLRFFISLIVDQCIDDALPNRGVLPLPNLETKFVAANTLLGIERPAQLMLRNPAIDEKERELAEVRRRHFTARTPKTKAKYRVLDAKLRTEIGELLKKDGFPRETTRKLAEWNPYDQNASADFFDPEWMFGIAQGFDIVIGNPPYIRIQNIDEDESATLKKNFVSGTGKFDIYVLFVEQAFKVIGPQGTICFIHPHRFLTADYGKGLKKFLDDVRGLRQATCFGVDQVFETATTYTGIFVYSLHNPSFRFREVNTKDFQEVPFIEKEYCSRGSHWLMSSSGVSSTDLLHKLRSYGIQLSEIFLGIFQGVVTVGDDIFIVQGERKGKYLIGYSDALGDDVKLEAGVMRPLLKGENIRRYVQPQSGLWVFYPHFLDKRTGKTKPFDEATLRLEFPLAYKYISNFREHLVEKKISYKTNPKYWYSLHRSRQISHFEQLKILTPQLQNYPHFTIDKEGWYPDAGGYSFIKKDCVKESYEFFLGILNSSVLWYFIKSTSNPYNNNYYYFKTTYLEPFSIPKPSDDEHTRLVSRVNKILAAKRADPQADTSAWEREIDQLVYQLYGLTPEEIKIVEGTA